MALLDDILSLLGSPRGETVARKPGVSYGREAMSRIGRTPIEFTANPIEGGKLAGLFDPNQSAMRVFVGQGRSPRQISRTIAHEDMHSVFEQQGQPDVTHKMLTDPQKPDESLSELDDIQRLLQMFQVAGR